MAEPTVLNRVTDRDVDGSRRIIRPSGLEIASGLVLGRVPPGRHPSRLDLPKTTALNPLLALERSILPALRREPCLVSFSGGMDSSFVLAVAARLAHREGLAPPIPITWRFTDAPRADESGWQRRVIEALPVSDWQLLEAEDELDLIGPIAQRTLMRYGVLYPANLHLHLPIIERAAGGSLLTGAGGDQILVGSHAMPSRPPALAERLRAVGGRLLDASVLGFQVPPRLAAAARRRPAPDRSPWLHPEISREVSLLQEQDVRSEPRRIDRRIEWHSRRRDLLMSCSALDAVGADHDVRVVNPYLDDTFLAALRQLTRGTDARTRAELLVAIADGSLPDVAVAYRPKAHFIDVFQREPTREFTRSWDGSGADGRLVNVAALRELWSRWPIPTRTGGLVQQLWLASAMPQTAGSPSRTSVDATSASAE